jgi:hypothetical protein
MSSVLLVSESKLKAFSNIHQNVDVALLTPTIKIAQDLHLQNLLGTKFLNEIYSQVKTSSLTTINKELIDEWISPYLIWSAVFEATPEIFMRMMNKSITIGDTEQGKSISVKEMAYLRDIYQSRFNFYAQRLQDELRNFPEKYPLYYSYTSKDGMPPRKETYFTGIHFPPNSGRYPPRGGIKRTIPTYYGGEFDCCR